MKIRNFSILTLGLLSLFGPPKQNLSVQASEMFNLSTTAKGAQLLYDNKQGSTDFAYLKIFGGTEIDALDHKVVVGFDALDVSDITGIGFRIKYRIQTFWDVIRNDFIIRIGGNRTHGISHIEEFWVSSTTTYSPFYYEKTGLGMKPIIDDELSYPAIGKVTDLIAVENSFRSKYDSKSFGSYSYKFDDDKRLSNSLKSFTKREYYAVIPFGWTDEITPESLDYYNIQGTYITSGTDNGKPFKVEATGDYYIDTKLTEDFGVSINGKNAVLKKIEVSNYPSSTTLKVLVDNASFNYDTQQTTLTYNRYQFIADKSVEVNWAITNENRHVFFKYSGDEQDAKQVKIRLYYTNENDKAAWILRVKGEKGFMPYGWDTTIPQVETIWDIAKKIVGAVFVVVILYFVIKLLILIFNLIGSGRKAFGRRR